MKEINKNNMASQFVVKTFRNDNLFIFSPNSNSSLMLQFTSIALISCNNPVTHKKNPEVIVLSSSNSGITKKIFNKKQLDINTIGFKIRNLY